MAVQLTDDVYWLNGCHKLDDKHLHVSSYLILGEQTVLIDTGSVLDTEWILSEIDRLTDTDGVDVIVLSHPDLPHSGNIPAIEEQWPDSEVFVFSTTPPLHGFGGATSCERGNEMNVGGRRFSWLESLLSDVSSTAWVYDHTSEVLFTVDGFGHYHRPGDCSSTSAELAGGIQFEDVCSFNANMFPWLEYVDPPKLQSEIATFCDQFEIEFIAPAHGNPIAGTDIDQYLETLDEAVEELAEQYEFPSERSPSVDQD